MENCIVLGHVGNQSETFSFFLNNKHKPRKQINDNFGIFVNKMKIQGVFLIISFIYFKNIQLLISTRSYPQNTMRSSFFVNIKHRHVQRQNKSCSRKNKLLRKMSN